MADLEIRDALHSLPDLHAKEEGFGTGKTLLMTLRTLYAHTWWQSVVICC